MIDNVQTSGETSPDQNVSHVRGSHADRVSSIFLDAVFSAAVIFVLLLGEMAAEEKIVVKELEFTTSDWIHYFLSPSHVDSRVVIVDMSNLKIQPGRYGRGVTDRRTLAQLVRLIAALKPAAMGIDIDFSPDPSSGPVYHSDDDPNLFDECLDLTSHGVPVYLGVFRAARELKARVLVRNAYAPLASYIGIDKLDNRVMPYQSEAASPDGSRLTSFAARLAQPPRGSIPKDYVSGFPAISQWADSDHERYYVDFSGIERLKDESTLVDLIDPSGQINKFEFDDNLRKKIAGNIVLLGSTDWCSTQPYTVPGLSRQPYPAVFIHAAAVQTLLGKPLYGLNSYGRISLDLLFAFLALGIVSLLRFWAIRHHGAGPAIDAHRLSPMITILLMIGGATFALFVNETRVMWCDFLVVFAAMALHHPVEEIRTWARHGFRARGRAPSISPKV